MDACMRNFNFVHPMAAFNTIETRSEMNDKGRVRAGNQSDVREDELVCPKPRRMGFSCCAPELIKPLYQLQRSSCALECEAGYEILEVFLNKDACVDGDLSNFGCSPPYCSPPTRASNPIVHDVKFCNQRSIPPIKFSGPKRISGPTFTSSPTPVRIEGFDCSMREARCDAHTFA